MVWAKPPAGAKPNMSHPHARGLRHCFLFNERTGRMLTDCVGGLQATFNGSPVWSSRLFGGSLTFDGSSDCSLVGGKGVFGRPSGSEGPYTVIAGIMQTGSQSGFQTIWANGNEGLYINNGRQIYYNAGTSIELLTTNRPYILSTSTPGSNATNLAGGEFEYVINGRMDFALNYQALPVMTGATIGGHGSERFIGEIAFIYVYDRFIPHGSLTGGRFDSGPIGAGGSMAAIHMDPFAMFYAVPRRAAFGAATHVAGSGGGGTGTGFNALLIAP